LKKTVGSEFASAARAYGYGVKSLQSVIDSNSSPEDINTFGIKKSTPQPAAKYNPKTGLFMK
jgi:hypothetical protein